MISKNLTLLQLLYNFFLNILKNCILIKKYFLFINIKCFYKSIFTRGYKKYNITHYFKIRNYIAFVITSTS